MKTGNHKENNILGRMGKRLKMGKERKERKKGIKEERRKRKRDS